jgi:hypothetical protein
LGTSSAGTSSNTPRKKLAHRPVKRSLG